GEQRLTYARSNTAPTMTGDSRGYGAYLGTVPDFKAMDGSSGGVLLSDVRAGGPAEQAGIKGGDRVLSIGGTHIENLYDMSYALQDHRPGQTVEVTVARAGEEITFRVTLGDRARMGQAAPMMAQALAPKTPADSTHEGTDHAAVAEAPHA